MSRMTHHKNHKNSHYFNKLLGSTVILAVIAYLTSDTTLKVVEGHKKSLEVQFQQFIETVQ